MRPGGEARRCVAMTRPVLDEFNRGKLDMAQASYPGRQRDRVMGRHSTTLLPNCTRCCGLVVLALILTTTLAFAERFTKNARFTGAARFGGAACLSDMRGRARPGRAKPRLWPVCPVSGSVGPRLRRWAVRVRSSRRPLCAGEILLLSAPRLVGPKGSTSGEVSERSKVPDSKSGVTRVTGGSNPSLSAVCQLKTSFFERKIPETQGRGVRVVEGA